MPFYGEVSQVDRCDRMCKHRMPSAGKPLIKGVTKSQLRKKATAKPLSFLCTDMIVNTHSAPGICIENHMRKKKRSISQTSGLRESTFI